MFTLMLPFAIAAWGLAGSYLAWLAFLLVGAGDLRLAGARRLLFPASRARRSTRNERARSPRENGQQLFPNERVWRRIARGAKKPRTWGLVVLYFVSFGGFLALTAWFPTYWINLHHVDMKTAGMLGGSAFRCWRPSSACSAACFPNGSAASALRVRGLRRRADRRGAADLVADFSINLAGELLIALGMGVGNAAVFKMVPKYVPNAVGGASGLVGGLGALGGFVIPPIPRGLFADALGPQAMPADSSSTSCLRWRPSCVSAYFWLLIAARKKSAKATGRAMLKAR